MRSRLALALAGLFVLPLAAEGKERPHVLLLTVDTLRADALSAYGYPHVVSPRLDSLAASGVLFEDAQTVIGKTGPAFASLFSSLYPPTHGARRNGVSMRPDVPVLAELLKAEGYTTAAFISNWTLRSRLAAVHRGFDHFDETFDRKRNAFGAVERSAEAITAASSAWLQSFRAQNPDAPLFLWVHYSEPHTPYVLHEEVAPPAPPRGARRSGWEKRWRYASEVAFTDQWVGRLLDRVEQHMPAADRLNVFVSDHGESMGEHSYWGHGKNAHWANLRIPLFFWGEGVPRGQRITSGASIVDVTPTVLDLLDIEAPSGFAGQSLRPAWQGSTAEPRPRYAIGDRGTALGKGGRETFKNPLQISLELGTVKAIFSFDNRKMEYFDLAQDPLEEDPLREPPVEMRPPLGRRLANWYRELEKYEARSGVLSDEDLEQLKSLGYVGSR